MANEIVTLGVTSYSSVVITELESTTLGIQGPPGPRGANGQNFKIDAVGLLSERSGYDDQEEGFSYLSSDEGNIYFRVGVSGWSDPVAFRGEQGPQGDQGPPGQDGIPDAPQDGGVYVRVNGAWVDIADHLVGTIE